MSGFDICAAAFKLTFYSKRLLAAAIHKKISIYEISNLSNTVVSIIACVSYYELIFNFCQIQTFEGHTGNVTAVSFHAEGKWVVTGSEDGTIKVWDLR